MHVLKDMLHSRSNSTVELAKLNPLIVILWDDPHAELSASYLLISLLEYDFSLLVPPKFFDNVSAAKLSVKEGTDLNLYCGASGKPAPNITWVRVFENGSASQVLHMGATWNIVNISKTDAGKYRCTANNGVGSSVSHTITVNVTSKQCYIALCSNYLKQSTNKTDWKAVQYSCI